MKHKQNVFDGKQQNPEDPKFDSWWGDRTKVFSREMLENSAEHFYFKTGEYVINLP